MVSKSPRRELPRHKRQVHIRKKIVGTDQRLRLSVFRSSKHIYVQLVDDIAGKVSAAASTLSKEIKNDGKNGGSKVEQGKKVGLVLAEKAKKLGIKKVVFDRSGYKFHGRVKALAEGARKGGLQF